MSWFRRSLYIEVSFACKGFRNLLFLLPMFTQTRNIAFKKSLRPNYLVFMSSWLTNFWTLFLIYSLVENLAESIISVPSFFAFFISGFLLKSATLYDLLRKRIIKIENPWKYIVATNKPSQILMSQSQSTHLRFYSLVAIWAWIRATSKCERGIKCDPSYCGEYFGCGILFVLESIHGYPQHFLSYPQGICTILASICRTGFEGFFGVSGAARYPGLIGLAQTRRCSTPGQIHDAYAYASWKAKKKAAIR